MYRQIERCCDRFFIFFDDTLNVRQRCEICKKSLEADNKTALDIFFPFFIDENHGGVGVTKIRLAELDKMLRQLYTEVRMIVHDTGYDRYEDMSFLSDADNITSPDESQLIDEYKSVISDPFSLSGFSFRVE